jgi:uncharacterized protein YjbJ (UPF0337 family)
LESTEEDTMSGKMDETKGRTKEAIGNLTDDDEMQREGKRDQAAGGAKDKIDDAADWAEEKVDDLKDRANR